MNIQLKTILVTTDFSGGSLVGVRYAVELAEMFSTQATLLHVVEPPSRMAGMEAVVLARTDEEVAALARVQLATLAGRESTGDLRLTACVHTGKPFHEIALAARERSADLIVIATHGHTGWKRALLGSTAERVVRHAHCPVLTVPTREPLQQADKVSPFKLKKILVPLDFSTIAEDALPWATFLAAQFDAELLLLHVTEKFPIDYLLGRELTKRTIASLTKQAKADLERTAGSLIKSTGRTVSVVARDGSPFEEICHAAKMLTVDLIVLTTHGHTGLKKVWLGSTAERVVRHSPCPVLVVRDLNRK